MVEYSRSHKEYFFQTSKIAHPTMQWYKHDMGNIVLALFD